MKKVLVILALIVLKTFYGYSFPQNYDDHDHEELNHPQLRSTSIENDCRQKELDTSYWVDKAQQTIANKLRASRINKNRAKNIIMFLGDGMSIPTLAATRAFIDDVSTELSFEKFPYFGLSRTYCVNKQVADSATTATAYLSGVKANYGTIGVSAEVPRSDCTLGNNAETHTESIASWAQKAGKATGLVTTARVTHASPAGVYAHTADRHWENDYEIKLKCGNSSKHIKDIAVQLLENPEGRNLKVILGGGRAEFRDTNKRDEQGIPGYRTDKRDLIKEWRKIKRKNGESSRYVWSRKGLQGIDVEKTDYLLGLFTADHNPFHGDRKRELLEDAVPSLTEMTVSAIEMLRKEKKGYFLFVEGARIDMAHHKSQARKSLEDTQEFANAVETARNMTSEKDTLIVVTSDHSHTMTISGYPTRGADILHLNDGGLADDGLPYPILSYANGPGYENTYDENGRRDMTFDDFDNPNYAYPSAVPLKSETHGGDDVGVFASGPQAYLFTGAYEQNNIPFIMAKIAEIGSYASNLP